MRPSARRNRLCCKQFHRPRVRCNGQAAIQIDKGMDQHITHRQVVRRGTRTSHVEDGDGATVRSSGEAPVHEREREDRITTGVQCQLWGHVIPETHRVATEDHDGAGFRACGEATVIESQHCVHRPTVGHREEPRITVNGLDVDGGQVQKQDRALVRTQHSLVVQRHCEPATAEVEEPSHAAKTVPQCGHGRLVVEACAHLPSRGAEE
mmetsp:Transcript_9466/g.26424  ORF Transcript_9466/g.26424 Transcript_9466/m.26424 type:complete len:208 (+) Transcript_9466:2267-2890(+)